MEIGWRRVCENEDYWYAEAGIGFGILDLVVDCLNQRYQEAELSSPIQTIPPPFLCKGAMEKQNISKHFNVTDTAGKEVGRTVKFVSECCTYVVPK